MKVYADKKAYVKPSTLLEGDAVFVKRDDNKRKSETLYRHDPCVITNKNGSMVTAMRTGKKLREILPFLSVFLIKRLNWKIVMEMIWKVESMMTLKNEMKIVLEGRILMEREPGLQQTFQKQDAPRS